MPQPGETRTVNGTTGQWDGQTWRRVASGNTAPADPSAVAGYHPGLADSEHPILSALKGFASGAAEATTPAKVGTLAALAIPGAGEAALTAAGVQAISDFVKTHFGTANAPKTFGDAARNTAGAALGAGIKGPIGKGYEVISNAVKNPKLMTGGTGAVLGGYEGYKRDGLLGAAEGAVLGSAGGLAGRSILSRFGGSLGDVAGDVAAEPSVQPLAARTRLSQEVPGSSFPSSLEAIPEAPGQAIPGLRGNPPPAPANAPRPGGKAPGLSSVLEDALKGLSSEGESTSLGDTPSTRSVDRGNMPASISQFAQDKYGINPADFAGDRTTGHFEETPNGLSSIWGSGKAPAATASASNDHDLFDMATAPKTAQPYEWPDAGGTYARNAEGSDVLIRPNEAPPAGANPDIPHASAPTGLSEFQEMSPASLSGLDASTAGAGSPSLKALARGDEYWGPGTLSRTGADPAMADESHTLLYDPQTPTSYLRDQLTSADNPADREYLARAIRQRYNINSRPGSVGPSRYAAPPDLPK